MFHSMFIKELSKLSLVCFKVDICYAVMQLNLK